MTTTALQTILDRHRFVLMEAAVIETLRRDDQAPLDPLLANTPLLLNAEGRGMLARIYREFIDVAVRHGCPLLICTPTWRAGNERIRQSGLANDVNARAVRFMRSLCADQPVPILVGGLMGCKNDCYRADQCLLPEEAAQYHAWQARQLASQTPDFLMAATLPAWPEALGLALAMGATGLPYILSFVIGADGRLLDGTALAEAIRRIDDGAAARPPFGYMINCAYPSFLSTRHVTPLVRRRLIGFQANASSKSHAELDNSRRLEFDDPQDWLRHMLQLHDHFGIRILGGCCGTNATYLESLAVHRDKELRRVF